MLRSYVLSIAVAAVFFARLSSSAVAQTAEPIKLGIITSLQGPANKEGRNWLEGAQLAAAELATQNIDVRLVVEDDETTTSKVASAFHKLVNTDGVRGIVGGTWDFLAEAAYPLALQRKIPYVTVTNPVEILSPAAQQNPFIFTNGLSLEAEKKAIAEFLGRQKVKTAATAFVDVPFGTMHAEMFDDLARTLGLAVVSKNQIPFAGMEASIKLAAAKITQARPELVFVVTDYNGLDLLAREFQTLRFSPIILTTQHLDEAFDLSKDAARYSNAYGVYPDYRRNGFDAAFLAKFGHAPRVYAASGYDAVQFLARAFHQGVRISAPDAVFRYDGVTGNHRLPARRSREIAETNAVIMTTKNGRFERD